MNEKSSPGTDTLRVVCLCGWWCSLGPGSFPGAVINHPQPARGRSDTTIETNTESNRNARPARSRMPL